MSKKVLDDNTGYTGMSADRMFGQAVRTEIDEDMMHVHFSPGPAWRARHDHPITSMSVKEAATALINRHGADKAIAWGGALVDNLRIEAARKAKGQSYEC